MATAPTEQTPLLASLSKTNELVDQTPPRPYKKQSRSFHIAITAAITFLVTLAVLVTVYFLFLKPKDSDALSLYRKLNSNDYNKNDLDALLASSWPRKDVLTVSYPASSYITIVEEALDRGKRELKKGKKTQLQEDGEATNDLRPVKRWTARNAGLNEVTNSESSSTSSTSTSTDTSTTSETSSTSDEPYDEETGEDDDEDFTTEDSSSTSDITSRLSDLGYIENEATKYLKNKNLDIVISYNATKELKWANETGCARLALNISCKDSPYRTLDGFCNNPNNPRWGTAMKPFRRALPAAYADGISTPRGGFDSNLPSALSVGAHTEVESFDAPQNFSEMLQIWGEFVNNDLSVAAKYKTTDGREVDCCLSGNGFECFPITINSTEEENSTCLNFVRSMSALRCSFGPREQLNEVSSFLDGSLLYGNTEYLGTQLRKFEDGLLEETHEKTLAWLPPIRAAVESYDPEASWGASFNANSALGWGSPSYETVGASRPAYDPDTPWALMYDSATKSSHNTNDGSWKSWFEKEAPWAVVDEQEDSFKLHKYGAKKGKKKSWNRKKHFSALGDFRPAEYAEAGSMRSVLVRQHNNVAKMLKDLHPEWDDETVFQEAKRIVTAQIQHITYNEFLPNVLGKDLMQKLDMHPKEEGYWTGYDENVDPTVSNEFAVAASRLSRAAIEKHSKKKSNTGKQSKHEEKESKNFDEMKKNFDKIPEDVKNNYWFKRSFEMLKGNLDFVFGEIFENNSTDNSTETTSSSTTTEGTTSTSTQKSSTTTTTESSSSSSTSKDTENSTEKEDETKSKNRRKRAALHELDSVSYDIQRGRDHGLPGYTEWRKYCNLSEVNSFDDLKPILTAGAYKNVTQLYRSVHDIDLYTGSMGEKPLPGSIVGPTSACLLTDQFYRVKFGDRHWYETNERPQSFTKKQLSEIKKTSLAGILCANIDHVTHVPKNIMWVVDENNQLVSCTDIEQPDLSYWFTPSTSDSYSQPTNHLDVDENQNLRELERESKRLKPYLDKLDLNLNGSNKEWNALELPSYITDYLSNHTSNADAVLHYDLDHMRKLPQKLPCNVTVQTRHVEIFRKNKAHRFETPREVLVNVFRNQLLVWSPNASDSLNSGFRILDKTGNFLIDAFNASQFDNETCFQLKPECIYYSKVVLGDLADEENLFEVSVSTVADQCSVIAPVLLQGYYVDEDTFYWTGALTIYVDEDRQLYKEQELSFQPSVRRNWVTLPKLNGTFTVRNQGKWDGHLPTVLNISSLAWYSTADTLVYPVQWSGYYEERKSFDGVFLMPQKVNESYVKWYDGEFSIILPKILPDLFKDLIRSNRVYSSVLYFTSNPAGVNQFDTSEFNKLHDWVFADYSEILIIGQFDNKGQFHWNGDISIHMAPLGYEYASTTYRPYGKYLFKVLEGNLYAQLGRSGSVKKWWSGVLPSKVIIPSGEYDVGLRAHVLDQYLIWSFDNFTATDGNGTFRMYQTRSQLRLWGDFEFQFAFLMDGIWTSTLKPNVTYFSPILLQYDRMTYDFGDDMPERLLLAYNRPDLGVLAPVTLLGEFYNATAFAWNAEALVTVIQK